MLMTNENRMANPILHMVRAFVWCKHHCSSLSPSPSSKETSKKVKNKYLWKW